MCARSGGAAISGPRRSHGARRGRTRARPPRAQRAFALLSARVTGGPEHLADACPGNHRGAVGVEHDRVARVDHAAADHDRPADRARVGLRSAADPDPARPDRQADRGELLDVSNGGVDEQRGSAAPTAACVARSSPTRATGAGSGIVRTTTSPGSISAITACAVKLSSWPQRTVRAGPAAREPATTCTSSWSTSPTRPAAS